VFSKPLAIVTGANRGIGFEVARQLAEEAIHVIMAVFKRVVLGQPF
jgi:NAD(P)-dependent dehydrogenase (short-subunit alcohol dehydrogenase family)